MLKYIVSIVILLASWTVSFSQEIYISASNRKLNKLLKDLDIELSFDSKALSRYRITVHQSFKDYDEALYFILKDTPFQFRNISDVYIIFPKSEITARRQAEKKSPVRVVVDSLPQEAGIQVLKLAEVIITAHPQLYSSQMGSTSAEVDIDAESSRYMPGSGDNVVFNLLRMMPGVRASNEPSNDLIVWGSRSGESRMIFDGIRLFGMHSYNDNISSINPYLARKIKLKKGGYGAEQGNQIGAIAEVSSAKPTTDKFSVKANLGTQTANLFASAPIKNLASLEVAWRRTFFDLYNKNIDNLISDYTFSDLNIRASGSGFDNDTYTISLYGADDRFDYRFKRDAEADIDGKNWALQFGAAGGYKRPWNEKTTSDFNVSYTSLSTKNGYHNLVQEFSARFAQNFKLKSHNIIVGAEVENYHVDKQNLFKPTIYVTEEYSYKNFDLKAGLRTDIIFGMVNLQPRISTHLKFAKHFNATLSWGLYNQYVSKVPYQDSTFVWGITKSLYSMHNIAGLSYDSGFGLFASAEGFFKKNYNTYKFTGENIVRTDVDIYGCDVFLKYDFTKGTVFSSYSLTVIPHDETGHEIKVGTLINLRPFIISANYVIGNGFTLFYMPQRLYHRLDLSGTYRIRIKKVQLQAGVSIMNITDASNLKYNETFYSFNNITPLYTKAMPISPMAFIEVIW